MSHMRVCDPSSFSLLHRQQGAGSLPAPLPRPWGRKVVSPAAHQAPHRNRRVPNCRRNRVIHVWRTPRRSPACAVAHPLARAPQHGQRPTSAPAVGKGWRRTGLAKGRQRRHQCGGPGGRHRTPPCWADPGGGIAHWPACLQGQAARPASLSSKNAKV